MLVHLPQMLVIVLALPFSDVGKVVVHDRVQPVLHIVIVLVPVPVVPDLLHREGRWTCLCGCHIFGPLPRLLIEPLFHLSPLPTTLPQLGPTLYTIQLGPYLVLDLLFVLLILILEVAVEAGWLDFGTGGQMTRPLDLVSQGHLSERRL